MKIRNPLEEALNRVLDNEKQFEGITYTICYTDYDLGRANEMASRMGYPFGYVSEALRELRRRREELK